MQLGTLFKTFYFILLAEKTLISFLEDLQKKGKAFSFKIKSSCESVTCVLAFSSEKIKDGVVNEIREVFSTYEILSDKGDLVDALQELMIAQKKTLALAESCTGGFLSHIITKNPGASRYFLGSFITYSNALKEKILFVPKETLLCFTDVSAPTVQSMLQGLFFCTQADVGIAVSGIAGPEGGSLEKPIGTVWFALGLKGGVEVGCLHLNGTREEIITSSSYILLGILYRKLLYNVVSF